MNKVIASVLLIALTAVFSFSQENEDKLKFGVRLGYNLNMVKDYDLGMGYGGGVKAHIPIVKSPHITFNPEVSFFYRSLFSYKHLVKDEMTEFAIGIPLVFQYVPTESQPLYVALGVQLDIPFSSEYKSTLVGIEKKIEVSRSLPDVGFVVGTGYHITKNISADARYVWGFTNIGKEKEIKYPLNQVGLGISYFF